MVILLLGCNRYDLLLVEDGREARGHAVDALFVLDNSESMRSEAIALAESFTAFVADAAASRAAIDAIGTDGLPDAVEAYRTELGTGFVDLQIGVTTIGAAEARGALLGGVLSGSDPGTVDAFVATVLCEATCFTAREDVPSDPAVQCDQPFDGVVTAEALDCLCGADAWLGRCGSSTEEGLESAYLARCRAEAAPPADCGLTPEEVGTSLALHREGAVFLPIIVTDEGDGSHRLKATHATPGVYGELFAAFPEGPPTFAVVAPVLDEELTAPCAPTVPSWALARYDYVVADTGGVRLSIHGEDCAPADWSSVFDALSALADGAASSYPLAREPVVRTITVEVGGRLAPRAEVLRRDVFRRKVWSDGWSYEAGTLFLHGASVPQGDDEVWIYYQPLAISD